MDKRHRRFGFHIDNDRKWVWQLRRTRSRSSYHFTLPWFGNRGLRLFLNRSAAQNAVHDNIYSLLNVLWQAPFPSNAQFVDTHNELALAARELLDNGISARDVSEYFHQKVDDIIAMAITAYYSPPEYGPGGVRVIRYGDGQIYFWPEANTSGKRTGTEGNLP